MNNQDIAKHSAAMLDLFESEQQRILLLDPKERAMQHNYQKTMAVCYELRTFIRSIDAKPSAVLEAAPASSAMAMQAVDPKLLSDAKHALERQRVWGGTSWAYNALQPRDYLPILARIDAALKSQQSPVQASDAGRQG